MVRVVEVVRVVAVIEVVREVWPSLQILAAKRLLLNTNKFIPPVYYMPQAAGKKQH